MMLCCANVVQYSQPTFTVAKPAQSTRNNHVSWRTFAFRSSLAFSAAKRVLSLLASNSSDKTGVNTRRLPVDSIESRRLRLPVDSVESRRLCLLVDSIEFRRLRPNGNNAILDACSWRSIVKIELLTVRCFLTTRRTTMRCTALYSSRPYTCRHSRRTCMNFLFANKILLT